MVTYREIVDTYFSYKKLVHSNPSARHNVRLMVPFLLMDVSYQEYCKEVKDYDCKHKYQAAKSRWRESYRKFNADFFMPFNQDQVDFIVDQMDEFEDYIHNKVVMLKSTVMSVFSPEASFEEKKILSSVLTSNVLAQIAQSLWGDMYRRNKWLQKQTNHHIEGVIKNSYDFAKNFPVARNVDLTSSDKVSQMASALSRDIIKYLEDKLNAGDN